MTARRFRVILLALFAALGVLGSGRTSRAAGASQFQGFVEPGAHTAPILQLIRSARRSIRLEVYLLTNRTIIGALLRAHAAGIDVRVMLEERPYGAERYAGIAYNALRAGGVSVRWANEGAFTYTHEKAMVVDGRVAGIFTLNLSSSGIFSNREFGVIDSNSTDASALAAIFDADWARRTPRIADRRLVVSPNNSRSDLDTLINSARHTLDIYAEEVNDAGVEGLLGRAVRRHVRVRLITPAGSPGVDAVRAAGVAVTLMPSPYVHAKAIVADNARVFIGSENLSTTSLDHNREVGLLTGDRGLVTLVESTFAADWRGGSATGPPPPPVQSAGSGPFRVRVITQPSALRRGQRLTIRVATRAGALCSVRVTYPDGYVSRSRVLARSEVADGSGIVSWSYSMSSTVSGTAHADVTCSLRGRTASGGTSFQVT